MQDDLLKQLLQQADDSASPAAPLRHVANLVRNRVRRRRNIQIATATAFSGVLAIAVYVISQSNRASPEMAKSPEINPPDVVIARSELSPEVEQLVADRTMALLVSRKSKTSVRTGKATDPQIMLDIERNVAAMTILNRAESLRQSEPEVALHEYRRAIELFPETSAAETARIRIQEHGI